MMSGSYEWKMEPLHYSNSFRRLDYVVLGDDYSFGWETDLACSSVDGWEIIAGDSVDQSGPD